jgi:hypothetical protein
MFKKWIILIPFVLLIVSLILPGCGGGSSSSNAAPIPPPAPGAPAVITVTPADKQLTVEWIAVYDATGYEVWYSTTNDPGAATQVTESFTGTSCIITGLMNGTTYYVWVRAINSGGTSDCSSVGTGTPVSAVKPPNAPNAPSLKGGDKEITVIWDSVAGAISYEVWYATANNPSAALKSTSPVTGTGTTITSLTNGATYYVWVKAVNSEGTSNFSPSSQVTLEIVYSGSIRGFVSSSGSYQVILVEQSKVLSFSSNNYFYFNSLAPGTYHVRIERTGYEGILKEVNLAQDAIIELGTFNPDSNPLPDGNTTVQGGSQQVSMDNCHSPSDWGRNFTIPQYAISATLTYLIKPIDEDRNPPWAGDGVFKRVDPSPYTYFSKKATTSNLSGSETFTNLLAGTYYIEIYCLSNDHSYMSLIWNYKVGGPKIIVSKTWANSTDMQEVYVECSDTIAGLKSAQYYLSKTTVKPTYWNAMLSQYIVQISSQGTWYLHVQATDNLDNVTYRCVGPFIIQ